VPKIEIKQFSGIAPKIDARLLNNAYGQIAENLKLISGSLQSWRNTLLQNLPAKAGVLKTIYLYTHTAADRWLAWTTDVDVVKAPISNDTTHRIYFTGDGVPKASDNANDTVTGVDGPGGNSEYPENSVTLGAPAPTAAPTVAVGAAGSNPTDHVYVYTFVSQWGEESAPSPASAIISVDLLDGQANLSALETTWPAGYNTLDKTRIYRSLSGTNTAKYQFVAEITPATTYNDTIDDTALGEVLPTEDYDLPPTDLFGIMDIGNGVFCGFTEFEVCFTEPYQPHAWPIKYRLAVVDKIVGGGHFGNSVVVCTDGQPVVITGNHPSAMTMAVSADFQACLSKRGIVSIKGMVIFPTPNGLYSIGYGGGRLLTEDLYDGETWVARNPEQLKAVAWDTRYIGFTDTLGIMVETSSGRVSASDMNLIVDAIYIHQPTDLLYICQTLDGINSISQFNAAGDRITYKWKSKKFSLGSQVALSAAKILANYGALLTQAEVDALNAQIAAIIASNAALISTGAVQGAVNSRAVNTFAVNKSLIVTPPSVPLAQNILMRVYGDGTLIATESTDSDKPFRLPVGERYRQYEVELEGFTDVNEVVLASSIEELV
jgi:hypothetical protein